VIAEGLEKHFPEIPVLSEEGKGYPIRNHAKIGNFFLG
jgi:3'-phosphoadenosine 5'-phosphosulfate (PAPS) 3'-phosphatase